MSNISLHLHLFYEDMGLYLLDRLSKVWDDKIYLSLANGNPPNTALLNKAEEHFDVNVTYVENKGNAQWGFINSVKNNSDDTEYILYLHDKTLDKKKWLDGIAEIFLTKENLQNSFKRIGGHSRIGIVASSKYRNKVPTYEEIMINHRMFNFCDRGGVLRLVHTLFWLKELQFIFSKMYDLSGNEEQIYPEYCMGTIFLARRSIIDFAHSCIHENFFEGLYRRDGNVEHALERFYYYVSLCLGYQNEFWTPEGTL